MASRKQRRIRKHRKQRQLNKPKEERIMPTPERIAKGDLEFCQDKSYRSFTATEIDKWYAMGFLGKSPKSNYRRDAYLTLHKLAIADSMFSPDIVNFRAAEIGHSTDDDDRSALDKFRHIIGQVKSKRNRDVLTELCARPNEPIHFSTTVVLDALDELQTVLEKRFEMLAA